MGTFTITAVHPEPRSWMSQAGGQMLSYRIDLRPQGSEDVLSAVEWARKASSPAPTVGQTLEGDLIQSNYGPKFKQASSGGGGGSREYKADPAKQRAIAMEAAQKVAVDVLRLAMEQGVWKAPEEKPVGEMAGVVKTIAQSLFSQIEEVAK